MHGTDNWEPYDVPVFQSWRADEVIVPVRNCEIFRKSAGVVFLMRRGYGGSRDVLSSWYLWTEQLLV
jgi:hypothetical protein